MHAINPYVAGNPVGDSPAYVGRRTIFRELLRVLRRPRDNALVLFGQRRIGKTSILQHLAAQLPEKGSYVPVYLDLQDKATWTLDRVLSVLASAIAEALGLEPPDLDDAEETFRDTWLPEVLGSLDDGTSLVLLFDEFDVLTNPESKRAGAAFFPYLRDLLSVDLKRLQFVFVIGRNVDDLDNIVLSLFKGTDAKRVSLLAREDTETLIRLSESGKPTLRWLPAAVERVWQLTNGHPFLTQQMCSHVWERAYDDEPEQVPEATAETVEAVLEDVLDSSQHSLEWLWDGLPPAERVVTSALAEAGPQQIRVDELETRLHEAGVRVVIRDLQNAPSKLQDWDILEPSGEALRFRVELLRRWLVTYKPLRRVQEELDYIEPVAQNLYEAALGLYRSQNLDQAIAPLRQAIGLNPNHLGANQLLADILISQQELAEARQILERLYEYQPAAARPRLVQVLLLVAEGEGREDGRLELFEQVLDVDPGRLEALQGRREIWIGRGDRAMKAGELTEALHAFEAANADERAASVRVQLNELRLEGGQLAADQAEEKRDYSKALEIVQKLAEEFPEHQDWSTKIAELEQYAQVACWYREGLEALEAQELAPAKRLLAQVVGVEPDYEEATRYLHLAVKGIDVSEAMKKAQVQIDELKSANIDVSEAMEKAQAQIDELKSANRALKDQRNRLERTILHLKQSEKAKHHRQQADEVIKERAEDLSLGIQSEEHRQSINEMERAVEQIQQVGERLQKKALFDPAGDSQVDALQPLSVRNPFDHLRLLLWVLWAPEKVRDYRQAYPGGEERKIGDWLQSTFLWLGPFLLMLYLGTTPRPRRDLGPDAFLSQDQYLGVALLILVILGAWGGIRLFESRVGRSFLLLATLAALVLFVLGLGTSRIGGLAFFLPLLFSWPAGLCWLGGSEEGLVSPSARCTLVFSLLIPVVSISYSLYNSREVTMSMVLIEPSSVMFILAYVVQVLSVLAIQRHLTVYRSSRLALLRHLCVIGFGLGSSSLSVSRVDRSLPLTMTY